MNLILVITIITVIFLGCSSRSANNLMDLIAINQTIKATPSHKNLGRLSSKTPIIQDDRITNTVEKNKKSDSRYKTNVESKIEMVGYLIDRKKDLDVNLYIYTFTDALRSRTIQFFSSQYLDFSTSKLHRVVVRDNFLKHIEPYGINRPTSKKINSRIKSAKEYFIDIK
jgi:hypothetical protein